MSGLRLVEVCVWAGSCSRAARYAVEDTRGGGTLKVCGRHLTAMVDEMVGWAEEDCPGGRHVVSVEPVVAMTVGRAGDGG